MRFSRSIDWLIDWGRYRHARARCTCGVKDQLSGVSYLLPPWEIQGLNLGRQAYQQVPTEPSHQPGLCISNKHYKWLSQRSVFSKPLFEKCLYHGYWCTASCWTLTNWWTRKQENKNMDIWFYLHLLILCLCAHAMVLTMRQFCEVYFLLPSGELQGSNLGSSSLLESALTHRAISAVQD